MFWCQDCTLLSWSSEVYAALGIFQLQTAVSLAKNCTVCPCAFAHALKCCVWWLCCVSHCWLSDGSTAIPGPFIYFFCRGMAWMWAWVCWWEVYTSLSFSSFLHTPRFSVKGLIFHPWKENWPKIILKTFEVGIKRHSS